jgi:predicted ribosomally synthesized peptide with nif11-like leader
MDQKLLAKAKTAKSAQELSRMAHEAGVTLSDAEADSYYAKLHQGDKELSDEELNNVAGGKMRERGNPRF